MALGGVSCSSVIVDATGNHSHPVSSPSSCSKCQIVRALEHLHSKLSVIHRGQCPGRPAGRGLAVRTRALAQACWAHTTGAQRRPALTCLLGQELSLLAGPAHGPLLPAMLLSPQTQSQFRSLVLRARMGWTVVLGRLSHLVLMCRLCVARHAGGVCTTAWM